jgi:hypothetical protein
MKSVTRVKFINTIRDTVDVLVNNEPAVRDMKFSAITNYVNIRSGTYKVEARSYTDVVTSNTKSRELKFPPNVAGIIVVYQSGSSLDLALLLDSNASCVPNTRRLRILDTTPYDGELNAFAQVGRSYEKSPSLPIKHVKESGASDLKHYANLRKESTNILVVESKSLFGAIRSRDDLGNNLILSLESIPIGSSYTILITNRGKNKSGNYELGAIITQETDASCKHI